MSFLNANRSVTVSIPNSQANTDNPVNPFPQGLNAQPISTGIPLSDRFKLMGPQPGQRHLAQGGAGYGRGGLGGSQAYASTPTSAMGYHPQRQFALSSSHAVSQNHNRALATALLNRENALLLKRKLMAGSLIKPMLAFKASVGARLGVKNFGRGGGRGHGRIVRQGGSNHGGYQTGRGRGGGKFGLAACVIAQGGFSARGRGDGISPLNRRGAPGGSAGGKFGAPKKSKGDLDKELDAYMSQSKKTLKSTLDNELDDYMNETRKLATASGLNLGAATATVTKDTNETDANPDEDVNMENAGSSVGRMY